MDETILSRSVNLKYRIHSYSSFSPKFAPENILVDNPKDQSSRWSTVSHVPPQFVMLKLDAPAIVTSITFGKYEKSHVCNVKKLQVWGGLTEEHLLLLLDGGLKNDSTAETFSLNHIVAYNSFPVRFIKLIPLKAWGSTFNFSLWHVALSGCPDPDLVQQCQHTYTLHCEREALRVCLKHLRHKRYTTAYAALVRETNTRLEHPILTHLYRACTETDDTTVVEDILRKATDSGLFSEYLRGQPLVPLWRQLRPSPGASPNSTPGMRGGHQLCWDSSTQTIYLFGGWDGQQDLSDLWSYSIPSNEWTCISPDTSLEGGPSARSCHKVCLDPDRRQLFTLGRYVDSKMRTSENLKSDFYLYELDSGRWTLITEDTAGVGGPKLVFDHQIVMDSLNRVIYVFGGKVLTQSRWEGIGLDSDRLAGGGGNGGSSFSLAEPQFSGLYRYHVATNTWTCLREDDTFAVNTTTSSSAATSAAATSSSSRIAPSAVQLSSASNSHPSAVAPNTLHQQQQQQQQACLKSRVGHSMLFHPVSRQLFILAGQRNKEYLTDFFTYQVDTEVVSCISESNSGGGAAAGGGGGSGGSEPGGVGSSSLLSVAFPNRADVPTAGFTQKATIDPILEEIHVLSGLSKEKEKRDLVCNSFWVYSIPLNKWSCIYHNEVSGDGPEDGGEPCPRFAHQLVYDHINKVHYMFGGNPGRQKQPKMRLDDFWALQLCRPTPEKLLKEAVFAVRKNRYEELAVQDSCQALRFLQTELHAAVDHTNKEQVAEFQRLACILFQPADPQTVHPPPLTALPQPPPLFVPQFADVISQYSSPAQVASAALDSLQPSHNFAGATASSSTLGHATNLSISNSFTTATPTPDPTTSTTSVVPSPMEGVTSVAGGGGGGSYNDTVSTTMSSTISSSSSNNYDCASGGTASAGHCGFEPSSAAATLVRAAGGVDGGYSQASSSTDPAKEQFEAWKHHRRSQLFNYLAKFFPEEMTQPKTNLEDLVPL